MVGVTGERGAERQPVPEPRRLLAEALGTMLLTLAAAGVDVVALTTGTVSGTARAVAPALMVMLVVFVMGNVSGAHINPVVTLAFTLRGVFPLRRLPGYWAAQLVGAVTAGLLVRALWGRGDAELGVPSYRMTEPRSLAVEAVLTVVLVLTILGTATRAELLGPEAALPVAGALTLDGLVGGHLSGAAMNPARVLGPAFATARTDHVWWVFVVGPVVGALLAVALARLVFGPPQQEEQKAASGDGE